MGKIRDMIIGMAVVLGFWGMMYPDFSLTADTYCKVENGNVVVCEDSRQDFQKILEAEAGEVEIRLAIVEKWNAFAARFQ